MAASGAGSREVWDAVRSGAALPVPAGDAPHPDLEWAASGAMALSGRPDGPPVLAPAPLASAARAAVAALTGPCGGGPALERLDGPALLGEHAACFGLVRRGDVSPGGSCRLVRAANGWLAVNLARPDDARAVPAWLEAEPAPDVWALVRERVRRRDAALLVERASWLGLPVAEAGPPPPGEPAWCRVERIGAPRARTLADAPLVVDLSAMWAGPLCTQLLSLAGAHVVKLESTRRPDGARAARGGFFDLLNAGKRCAALDFASPEDLRRLRALLERADIVVEASRPRALAQLGIDAAALLRARPGLTWVSLTGYGRTGAGASRAAFGDDAAAAAGLCAATGGADAPLFCGDAVADPLGGVYAAVAALASFRAGGGHLIDVSLSGVVAHLLARPGRTREARVERGSGFEVVCGGARSRVREPRARPPAGRAGALGSDTAAVLAELGIAC
jgi:crotonobetainyl-CoA:carnitine CoA-transferase CaiB-like acyl-CoA transferase